MGKTCIAKLDGQKLQGIWRYANLVGKKWITCAIVLALAIGGWQGALAQQTPTFDSGSNGSDGVLNLTQPSVVVFDPRAFNPPLDQDGDKVFHFTTITIAAGVTVRMKPPQMDGPIYWLATGAVKIDGIIDLNGEDGYANAINLPLADRRPSIAGSGGFPGGVGRVSASHPAQDGSGPGAGKNRTVNGLITINAGHAVQGYGGGGQPYGNDFLTPLIGGSGGGGDNDITSSPGAGAGGGALLIASSVSIAVNGTIRANGGSAGGRSGSGG